MRHQHSIYLGYQPIKGQKGQLSRIAPWSISYRLTFQADNKTIYRTVKHLITLSSFQSPARGEFWGCLTGLSCSDTSCQEREWEEKQSLSICVSPTLWSQASKLKQSINIMAFNPHIPRKHLFLYPLFFSYIPSLSFSLYSRPSFCITIDTKSLTYCSM